MTITLGNADVADLITCLHLAEVRFTVMERKLREMGLVMTAAGCGREAYSLARVRRRVEPLMIALPSWATEEPDAPEDLRSSAQLAADDAGVPLSGPI